MVKSRAYTRREPGWIRGYLLKRKYHLTSIAREHIHYYNQDQGVTEELMEPDIRVEGKVTPKDRLLGILNVRFL